MGESVFDIVIRLRQPEAAALGGGQVDPKIQRREAATRNAMDDLVSRLGVALASVCLVFHNTEGRTVALKWRPSAFLPQPQGVIMGEVPHTMLALGAGKAPLCVPNVLCLVSAVTSLADGL